MRTICNMERYNVEKQLHKRGLRATLPRTLVLGVLAQSGRHYTMEELWRRVQESAPEIELSTLYRVVQALTEAGLAGESRLPNGVRVVEGRADEHGHWVCSRCGEVQHFPPGLWEQVNQLVKLAVEPEALWFGVQLGGAGLCPRCRDRAERCDEPQ